MQIWSEGHGGEVRLETHFIGLEVELTSAGEMGSREGGLRCAKAAISGEAGIPRNVGGGHE